MLVELHGLAVRLLRVGEQVALHVLALGHLEDRLRANPLVDVERDWIDDEPPGLPLSGPLEPGLTLTQRVGDDSRLVLRQRSSRRRIEKRGQLAGPGRRVETQYGRQMRIVRVVDLRRLAHASLRGETGGRVVLARRIVPIVGDWPDGRLGTRRFPSTRHARPSKVCPSDRGELERTRGALRAEHRTL